MDNIESLSLSNFQAISSASSYENDLLVYETANNNYAISRPNMLEFDFACYCKKGELSFKIDGEPYRIEEGDLCLITAGHIVSDLQFSSVCETLGYGFSQNYLIDTITNIEELAIILTFNNSHHVLHLSEYERNTFVNYFKAIKSKIVSTDNVFRGQIINLLFRSMAFDMADIFLKRRQNKNYEYNSNAFSIFLKFMQLLKDNYITKRRVSWYSNQLNITSKYLAETVKKTSGSTPGDWIDMYVVKHLRLLLKESTKSMKEISDELHFSNQSFMGKYFKQHMGMSPSEFRKS